MSEAETKAEPETKYEDYPYDKDLGVKFTRRSGWLDYVNTRHRGYNNSEWDKNLHLPIFKTEEEYDVWAEKERKKIKEGTNAPASFLRRLTSRFTGNFPEKRFGLGGKSRKNKHLVKRKKTKRKFIKMPIRYS